MSLEIYPRDFRTRYEISHAISLLLSGYYDKVGKMTVVVPINDYNIKAIQNDCIMIDTDRGFVYQIQNVKTDTELNRITFHGFTAEAVLDRRVLPRRLIINNLEQGVYKAVNENLRGLNLRTAESKGLPDSANGSVVEEGQLLEKTTDLLKESGLGRRAVWDPEKLQLIYEIYKGTDRTEGIHAVVFSDEQGTARQLVINDDVSRFKNVAYITVEYSDGTVEIVTVGQAEGPDRREIWSNRRIRQAHDESRAEAKNRAKSEAALELARNLHIQNFSVAIDPAELGTGYSIGDTVACVSVRFGVSFKARVAGVKYTMDITGQKTEVILGEPTLTAIGGINLAQY